jgi:hypothetical protein
LTLAQQQGRRGRPNWAKASGPVGASGLDGWVLRSRKGKTEQSTIPVSCLMKGRPGGVTCPSPLRKLAGLEGIGEKVHSS